MKIVEKLRDIAEECERGERSPISGISTWPKETTVEYKAAHIIEQAMQSLLTIIDTDEVVPSEALRFMAQRNYEMLLGLCNAEDLDS
jgi:hypothetical protein